MEAQRITGKEIRARLRGDLNMRNGLKFNLFQCKMKSHLRALRIPAVDWNSSVGIPEKGISEPIHHKMSVYCLYDIHMKRA